MQPIPSESTNYDVVISFYDSSHIRISFPNDNFGIASEIQNRFAFFVDGYRYMPKFKAGVWDGKIKLYDIGRSLLDYGLLQDLVAWCAAVEYKVYVDPVLLPEKDITIDHLSEFCTDVLKLPFDPYDHQLQSALAAIKTGRKIIQSATSSGKSLILYIVIQWYRRVEKLKRQVLIVPSVGLVTQMLNDFVAYAVNDTEQFSADDVLCIPNKQGIKRDSEKNLTITTWQSLQHIKGIDSVEWFQDIDALYMDEVQSAKGTVVSAIVKKTKYTLVKIGLSGTVANNKTDLMSIKGLFGPIHKGITTEQLIKLGHASRIKLTAVQLDHPGLPNGTKMAYSDEISYIVNHPERNDYICRIANSFDKNTLILFNFKVQGLQLCEWFAKNAPSKEVLYVTGDSTKEHREEVRVYCASNDNAVIIASYGVFQAGVSINNLHNVILASPTKSAIRLLQSIGRVLRNHDSKEFSRVIDIFDDMTDGKQTQNHTLKHFFERYTIYNNAKIPCSVIEGATLSPSELLV